MNACTGQPGWQGFTGQPGDIGPQGFTGNTGEPGQPGLLGEPGNTGARGRPGATGFAGQPGSLGDAGTSKVSCCYISLCQFLLHSCMLSSSCDILLSAVRRQSAYVRPVSGLAQVRVKRTYTHATLTQTGDNVGTVPT